MLRCSADVADIKMNIQIINMFTSLSRCFGSVRATLSSRPNSGTSRRSRAVEIHVRPSRVILCEHLITATIITIITVIAV